MVETANKIQRYERYKDSGVEWLGQIPEHWEVLSSKRFHTVGKQLNSKRECENVLSLTLRGVVNNNPDAPEGMVPKDYATYQIFDKNNLVFKLIDLENVRTSRVGIVHEKGIMSSAYIRLIIGINNLPRFAYYYYFNLYLNEVYNNMGSGVRSTLGPTDLLNISYIQPPLREQTVIAQFLDDKITKIDQAIAIKEQQIALLKERKQILIHKAVTRGLDDSVALKDSGVEWIGKIPEGWEVKKVKHLTEKSFSGGTPSTDKLDYWDGGIPWLSSVDIKTDYLRKTNREISLKGFNNSSAKMAPKGSLVFVTRSGILQHTFALSIIKIDMAINQDIKCLILTNAISPEYFLKIIKGNNDRILVDVRQQAATVESIDMGTFFNLEIPLPNKIEQKEISSYIENTSQKIETAIDLKQQEIEKMKEYKSSLINSVVTGKIKIN